MKLSKSKIPTLKHQTRNTLQEPPARTRTIIPTENPVSGEQPAQSILQHVVIHRTFPNAKSVLIAGSFNGWIPSADELKNCGHDCWHVDLMLKPGRYEYRFVVNEQWTDDPVTENQVPNPFGGHNSVLLVSAPGKTKTETAKIASASGLN